MEYVIYICAAALVVFAVWQTAQRFRGKTKSSCCGGKEVVSVKKVADTDESHYPYHYTLDIADMACSNCARHVENAFNDMDGVWAKVNLGRKEAKILSKQVRGEADFAAALSGSGYSVVGFRESAE